MSSIRDAAELFFDACEAGKGWEACEQYCHPGATFTAQTEALADVTTLEAYTEWMKGLLTILPDGTAEVRSFAVDEARNNVAAFGVFRGTHRRGRAGAADRQVRRSRLRLRDGLRRRQDPPHDKDLERRAHHAPTRLGMTC
jgi:hypothetical protein